MILLRNLFTLALVLALVPLHPAAVAVEAPAHLAADAEEALARLRARVLADADEGALAFADARVFNASLTPPHDARTAWARAEAEDADVPPRLRVLDAEAALLALASANVRAALDAGDAEAARAWLTVAVTRAGLEARGHPFAAHAEDAESVREALDAALATRAREAVVTAMLLQRAGLADDARVAAAGAGHLLAHVVADASPRLRDGLATPLRENATRVPDVVGALPEKPHPHDAAGLLAPLTALSLNRDVEALDTVAARNADAAFAVARAAREDPALLDVLARAARSQYGADRGFLFLKGEGDVDAVDAAHARLEEAAASRGAAAVADAARAVRDALVPVALLEPGIVLKVETGGLQPGRVHEYKVTLVRPPLEGVTTLVLDLAFDADVVRVLGYRERAPHAGSALETADAGARLTAGAPDDDPFRRSVVLGVLQLEATGPGGAESALAVVNATFTEPDGDAAVVYRLRDGHVTVAVTPADLPGKEKGPEDTTVAGEIAGSRTPFPGLAITAVVACMAALARRRR